MRVAKFVSITEPYSCDMSRIRQMM